MSSTEYTGKLYYLNIWKSILWAFLRWPEKKVLEWVEERKLSEFLDDPEDIIYHETPPYWITNLLVPDTLKRELSGTELSDLQGRILLAFRDERHYKFNEKTDWKPYRIKIEQILQEYNQRLPTIDNA